MIDETTTLEAVETEQVSAAPVETPAEAPKIDQKAVEAEAERLYQQRNFKMLREQAEAIARENAELKKRIQAQPEENYTVANDDLVEGKHLVQQKKYVDQQVEELKEQLRQQQILMTENLIRSQCPDFDNVVTEQNLAKLRNEYPEVAESLGSSSDLKNKAVAAYKLIKKLNISGSQVDADRDLIAKNMAKPKVSASLPKAEGDLARANAFERGFTDAEKEERYKQMKAYANQ